MNTTHPLYLVTYSASRRGVSFGFRSARVFGVTAAEALTKFHRAMQLRRAFAPHEYRVTGISELDRVRRTVVARLLFPQGPNPRFSAPVTKASEPSEAVAQTQFAF